MQVQESLAVRGGYVPENCREWQNRKRREVSSMRIVVTISKWQTISGTTYDWNV